MFATELPTKPLETFLISDGTPFRIDGLDNTISAIHPRVDIYDLSQPDSKHKRLRINFPRELVEEILDHLCVAYLKNKEFGRAMLLQLTDKAYQQRMHRRWISREPRECPDKYCICYSRALGKFFYFGMIMFDYAFDVNVIDPFAIFDDSDLDDDLTMNRTGDIPVITINHPYSFSRDGAIKPHHLVAMRRHRDQSTDWMMLFNVVANAMMDFQDFENKPTVAWTGRRVCDCMVMDAVVDRGVYKARKVLYPLLVLRIDTEVGFGSEEWMAARWHWQRFAEMVSIAFEGAALYIVNREDECIKV